MDSRRTGRTEGWPASSFIRVLIADGMPILSEALAFALNEQNSDLSVFDEHPMDGPEAVAAAASLRPDVALVDQWLPGMEAPSIVAALRAEGAGCRVLLFSWLFTQQHIDQALQAGAAGFLSKSCTVAEVADAITRVHSGELQLNAEELKRNIEDKTGLSKQEAERFSSLTAAETETLGLLNHGRSYQQVAQELSISPKTVRNRISRMLGKTQTQSQAELLAKARACGFFRI